ncbi:MAG: bifunctional 2-C-methyl-D-erythritol 4-phosphate cytidylyltransferase/2-C-methyl-D-erythritol 2,4-cyclodiphosphate synthase [Oceanicaulis sp.]|uniref:bifunctional 2-C-methyl-D-erythritol 4-phosphate cytidylyltransferase/2-C-methyl-D-erythritol 2,4-cyclodiphosphate synthase n=1 Tax=Glycocaulis sp. TaxID=1969725 RepID=UPI0025C1B926|nr:bifunctional 2-C-methyl-D-erythritol 4-phosphate cytidylyltransferase/2-C-methyl-D-erythritol 2,4-cyclodiphosphate synthase [Glycocaulis sp.]MCC5981350.1 bifunctional 2-C-methyl-D-erythritol 4-phosphate cytidylyltransferase/2-C-methyl-D-erythritol 2,4-cyclodiphosphate synthase [Oceanicaulis sp.]
MINFSACIVAAGSGTRTGQATPKQFIPVAGKPLLRWSAEALASHPRCKELIIAINEADQAQAAAALEGLGVVFVEGGATRTRSVHACIMQASQPYVLVHDAARPGLGHALIDRLLAALESHSGAAPALPLPDALARQGEDGVEPVSRDGLMRIQTPQAFHLAALSWAFDAAGQTDYPDEISLVRAAGLKVALVEGDEAVFKVTYPEDFARAERLLGDATPLPVTGTGFDVHRLAPGKGVHLCGVFIECGLELVGHSDADVGLHALTDAILGAAGAGDIGQHFPPSDERWRGADSAQFLIHAMDLAREAGITPVHADVTLICERPKVGPHREAMRARIAELTGLPLARVNVKATTTEQLGFTGRGEGIAAQAVFTGALK